MKSERTEQEFVDSGKHTEMVHVLKVYFKSEIRRIAVTSYVVSHYNVLCEKMLQLFPSLSGRTFFLGWKDEEGDDIVMSSDAELAQAVASAQDGVIKVFVRLTDDASNIRGECDSAPTSNQLGSHHHVNVTCDACNSEIHGNRYKCLQCRDYDLCHSCNALDKHPGHDMLKMSLPATEKRKWNFLGIRRMWSSMFGFHPFVGGHKYPCGHHGKKFCRNAGGEGGATPSDFQEKYAESGKDFLQAFGASMANLFEALGADVRVSVESGSDQDQPEPATCSSENQPAAASGSVGTQENPSKDSQATASNAEGNKVASAEPQPGTSAQGTSPVDDANNAGVKTAKDVFMEFQEVQKSAGDDDTPNGGIASDDKGARPKSAKVYPNLPSENDIAYGQSVAEAFKRQAEKVAANLQQYGFRESSSPPDGWTFLNSEPADENTIPKAAATVTATATAAATAPPTQDVADMVVDDTPKEGEADECMDVTPPTAPPKEDAATSARTVEEPLEPEIASALEMMLSMGYENEGGWLVRLLKAKHGNISEAMDSIYK